MVEIDSQNEALDRNSSIPLHRQLWQIFKDKIDQEEWRLGEVIPKELDLMEEYGVSRYTIRQTLDDLVQAGFLIRTKKRGTLVRRPKVEQDLSRFYSFARDMSEQGLEPTSIILNLEEIIPDEITAAILKLESGNRVYHLRRLRLVAGEPLVLESSYLAFGSSINLSAYDWRIQPLYEILENHYGLKIERAEEYLEPENLDPETAALLGVEANTPAFRVERLTYNSEGRIFERRISLIRGDRYRFHINLPKVELVTGN
ncbi:MAG: GntR family transcriptional regulator [Chloroflexi bacterium]|uniref:GntR family transcriptional regulator n=1 Tax=Candidatus Chlorohelix allophototropha TaxID=3003348 RepID=A0A8T7M4J4_9CHLR|nr:GntR family transcriptional regulator [Chloroflexota bacterium]WJW70005.1 GntR family transcriptional regulator [Chloroflexota bacterium L227-S17]